MNNFYRIAFSAICICALWSAVATSVEGSSRRLLAPAPGPGSSGPPCTCSIASIFSGVTYCFALTDTPGGNTAKQASPNCKVFPSAYTCGNVVNLASTVRTAAYPNATISGSGLQCKLASFHDNPVPAPTAPPASAGAQPCIGLPAGDYGPQAIIAYARGPDYAATPDCTVSSGTVCSIYIPLSNGTAKICNSQNVENQLRG